MVLILDENEVKEKILNLHSRNTFIAIMPEFRGCIARYCLKTEEEVLEPMRPATQARLST